MRKSIRRVFDGYMTHLALWRDRNAGSYWSIQLTRIDDWCSKRLANANAIWNTAKNLNGLRVPNLSCGDCNSKCDQITGCTHAAYKCYVFVEGTETDRDAIMASINKQEVPCFSGSCSEVYLERAFDNTGFRPRKRLPNAKLLGETSLMFLCHQH